MKTYFSSFCLGLSLFAIASPLKLVSAQSFAQEQRTPQSALEQIIFSNKLESQWFSPEVLQNIPLSRLQEAMNEIKTKAREELGEYKSMQFIQDDQYRVIFKRGSVIATIRLDQNGGISAIGFDNPKKF
jgi:hypothetical protein